MIPPIALPNILMLLGFGVLVGLINGLVVSFLKVPSFITTLGMMMVVRGAALYYVGGAPQGYLTDNFRAFGRNYIQNVPFFTRIPYALIILIILAMIAYFIFHRTNYGRQILAVGDNMRASQLSGVRVKLIRVMTFIFCSVFAVLGGIMIGGYWWCKCHHWRRDGNAGDSCLCDRWRSAWGWKGQCNKCNFWSIYLTGDC